MPTNKLLSALPSEDRDRLSPFLTTSPMRLRLVLYKQDAVIDDVYFPCSGVLSLTRTMEDGETAEVYAIGNEGMIGASVFFGDLRLIPKLSSKLPVTSRIRCPLLCSCARWSGTVRFISASCGTTMY